MGKGSSYRPVDKKRYDENYARIFAHCKNIDCPLRYTCFRYLRTPFFDAQYIDFKPIDDKCDYFVPDKEDK